MNVVEPFDSRTPDRSPDVAPHADAPARELGSLTVLVAIAAVALFMLRALPQLFPALQTSSMGIAAAAPVPTLMPGALLLVLAGVAAATVMAQARHAAGLPTTAGRPTRRRRRWRRIALPALLPRGYLAVIGRAARWPQAVVVGCLALACLLLLRTLPQATIIPGSIAIGCAAIVLCFPLLVADCHFAAVPASRNPEAAGLHAMFLLCIVVWAGAGLVQIALGLDVGHAGVAQRTDVALASADVVLMTSDLRRLATGIRLSRCCRRTIQVNVALGLGWTVVLVALAAFGLLGAQGAIVAALLHNLSTFIGMASAGRLLLFDETPRDSTHAFDSA